MGGIDAFADEGAHRRAGWLTGRRPEEEQLRNRRSSLSALLSSPAAL
jgi:hypothetical protein